MRVIPRGLILLGLITAVIAAGCGRPSSRPTGKMIVAASIAPLANFSEEVGGKYVDVTLLVPPGSNPHTYQIQPDQMAALSRASVLVLNGVGLEFWANNAIDAANNPKLIVVRTSDGLKILDHSGDEAEGNPHVWLDPINAIHQVELIRDAFVKADPKHAAQYRSNASRFVAELRTLGTDIRRQVSTFKSRSFISYHPTWVYFAHRYGLTEAATIERSPGREPSPADIKNAVDEARKLHARAIFAEPQVSHKAADVVAEEVGAKIILLDAFGKPPKYDYIKMMRNNVNAMATALR